MTARTTYDVGTDLLANPKDMRRFNELIHRVASFQMKIVLGNQDGMPPETMFAILQEACSALRVDEDYILTKLSELSSKQVH